MSLRYAVVGLGHIAQVAVLPAFKHARRNSELAALVSGDPVKLRRLAQKYGVDNTFFYEEYDVLLDSGLIDAVYIALPNHMHEEFALRALSRGIHVLCEKPLALTSEACWAMIRQAKATNSKLMTAYRLHFEPANLTAIQRANDGSLGELRYFNSVFSYQIKDPGNIRVQWETGGGPVWDIGIYCVNAARNLFKAEPLEVTATKATGTSRIFAEVEEMMSVTMRFPKERLATFTCSFGANEASSFELFGTKGHIKLENAYDYATSRKLTHTVGERKKTVHFRKADQFAPELLYFSDCVLNDRRVEPSGYEGLADVNVIETIYRSARLGRTLSVQAPTEILHKPRPTLRQRIQRPGIGKVEPIHASSASGD